MIKKVIEVGQDSPPPDYVKANTRTMEKCPFDGVAMHLPADVGGGLIFDVKAWNELRGELSRNQARELTALSSIQWGERLTDNFILVYARSTMDWFSDADWRNVLENVRFCARAARAGGCRGILWDPEPYTRNTSAINPWVLGQQPGYEERSFADYETKARERGGQFMQALQEEFPGVHVLSMRILSDFAKGSPFTQPLFDIPDPETRAERLSQSYYGLHPAFFNGMLDAAAPDVVITDANEDAYFYTSAIEYYHAYKVLRQDALVLVAPENHVKYRAQVRIRHAVSIDYVVGRWAGALAGFSRALSCQALELTPEQQAQWLEHNLYYAVDASDHYAWVWSEKPLNWWTKDAIPSGIEEALWSARRKHDQRQPLGFAIEAMLQQARQHAAASD